MAAAHINPFKCRCPGCPACSLCARWDRPELGITGCHQNRSKQDRYAEDFLCHYCLEELNNPAQPPPNAAAAAAAAPPPAPPTAALAVAKAPAPIQPPPGLHVGNLTQLQNMLADIQRAIAALTERVDEIERRLSALG